MQVLKLAPSASTLFLGASAVETYCSLRAPFSPSQLIISVTSCVAPCRSTTTGRPACGSLPVAIEVLTNKGKDARNNHAASLRVDLDLEVAAG